jgi:hypothetical protein
MHRLNSGDQAVAASLGCCAHGHEPGDNSGIETLAGPAVRNPFRQAANFWWFWLIAGIFWVVVALVVVQFDGSSITEVGVMIGFIFMLAGLQNLLFGAFVGGAARWILWIFGVLFLVAGVVLMISPEETFAGVADILGFIFLLVGFFWLFEALTERDANELWWFGADLRDRDAYRGLLDRRPVLHREAIRPARLHRHLVPIPRGRRPDQGVRDPPVAGTD